VFCWVPVPNPPQPNLFEIQDTAGNCLSVNTGQHYDNYPIISVQAASACNAFAYDYDFWIPLGASSGGSVHHVFQTYYDDLGCLYVNAQAIVTSCGSDDYDTYQQFDWG
jgi:hypothetical protein